MKLTFRLLILFIVILTINACKKSSYRKTPGGMPYMLYASKDTQKAWPGNILKLSLVQKINDSIIYTTEGKSFEFVPVSTPHATYDLSELWMLLKKGDSIVATQMMDTFIKRNPTGVPVQFKKGDRIMTFIKVHDIFASDSLARLDSELETKAALEKEVAFLENYLKENNITAQKTPSGAFVQIFNPGTGDLVDSGKFVSVNYTGTSFSGTVFDSNTDTSFHHTEPLVFKTAAGKMIKGFDEAMLFLKKGAKAKVFIPSMLGYGGNPNSPNIKPFEHLIFDIELLDVSDTSPGAARKKAAN